MAEDQPITKQATRDTLPRKGFSRQSKIQVALKLHRPLLLMEVHRRVQHELSPSGNLQLEALCPVGLRNLRLGESGMQPVSYFLDFVENVLGFRVPIDL